MKTNWAEEEVDEEDDEIMQPLNNSQIASQNQQESEEVDTWNQDESQQIYGDKQRQYKVQQGEIEDLEDQYEQGLNYNDYNEFKEYYLQEQQQILQSIDTMSPPFIINAYNLNFKASDRDLANFLKCTNQDQVKIFHQKSGRSTGEGQIITQNGGKAKQIMQQNQQEFFGRKLILELFFEQEFWEENQGEDYYGSRQKRQSRNQKDRYQRVGGRNRNQRYNKKYNYQQQNHQQQQQQQYQQPQQQQIQIPKFTNTRKNQPQSPLLQTQQPSQKPASQKKVDPFGGAKPVDTLKKELEIEQRKQKKNEEETKAQQSQNEQQNTDTNEKGIEKVKDQSQDQGQVSIEQEKKKDQKNQNKEGDQKNAEKKDQKEQKNLKENKEEIQQQKLLKEQQEIKQKIEEVKGDWPSEEEQKILASRRVRFYAGLCEKSKKGRRINLYYKVSL